MMNAASGSGGNPAGSVGEEMSAPAADGFDPSALVRDYGDVEGEVAACRKAAALFDFSFMSAARVSGPGALSAVARLTDRRLDDLAPGRIRYALSRGPEGWLRSDLTVWNEGDGRYLIMSGLHRDIAELIALAGTVGRQVSVDDLSGRTAILSVQGPAALRALGGLLDAKKLAAVPYFGFMRIEIGGVSSLVGRLGYTGERGFEIMLDRSKREQVWAELAARARPGGFAAVDCLRIEAGFVLFTNEFRLPATPAEAGLGRFAESDARPPRCRLACFRAAGDDLPVPWCPTGDLARPEPGTITVTSACRSALAGGILGLGYVPAAAVGLDRAFIDPSARFRNIRTVPLPFYDPTKRRPRGNWR
jgi:glycine cleavage system aminomethyltransferase T